MAFTTQYVKDLLDKIPTTEGYKDHLGDVKFVFEEDKEKGAWARLTLVTENKQVKTHVNVWECTYAMEPDRDTRIMSVYFRALVDCIGHGLLRMVERKDMEMLMSMSEKPKAQA